MIFRESCILRASAISTALSVCGWAVNHFNPHTAVLFWITLPLRLLAIPGFLLAVIMAAAFSPQGFHGGDDFVWLVLPGSWLTYFLLVLFNCRSKYKKSQG